MDEHEKCVLDHLAAALALRLFEIKDSEFSKALKLPSGQGDDEFPAALVAMAILRKDGKGLTVDPVLSWAQRNEPPRYSLIYNLYSEWSSVDPGIATQKGMYLGNNLVAIIHEPTEKKD